MLWQTRCWFFPELDLFESREEAEEAFCDAWRELRRDPWYWLWLMVAGAVFVLLPLACFTIPVVYSGPPRPPSVLDGIPEAYLTTGALIVFVFLPPVLHHLCWSRLVRGYLRERLALGKRPLCTRCGYDLRGLRDSRCPECGTTFDRDLLRPAPPGWSR
jgi:hypothetical protein